MPKRERSRRMRALRRRVRENDVAKWSATFLETLTGAGIIAPGVSDPLETAIVRLATHRAPARRARLRRHPRAPGRPAGGRACDRPLARRDRAPRHCRRHPRRDRLGPRAREPAARWRARPTGPCSAGRTASSCSSTPPASPSTCATRRWPSSSGSRRIVDEVAASADGAWIERKPAGLALHTRRLSATAGTALQHVARDKVEAELLGITVRTGKVGARVRRARERQGRVAHPAAPARRGHARRSTSATT